MKKILKIAAIALLVLLIALISVPYLFKYQIVAKIKKLANNELTATIEFGEIDLSLIRSFPDFSLEIKDFSITGEGDFKNIELARIANFAFTLDLISVLKGESIQIKKIGLTQSHVHVIVLDSLRANYLITKEEEILDEQTTKVESNTEFSLKLKEYSLKNFNLIYDDQESDMYAEIVNLNHKGSGNFTQDIVNLITNTKIEKLTFKSEGIALLKNVSVDSEFGIKIDQSKSEFTFLENYIRLNELQLNFEGAVQLLEETMELDIKFDAPKTAFRNIISLIPAVYYQDFSALKTSGAASLSGYAKGTYDGLRELYPSFNVFMNIKDGFFQYPDLPAAVENVNVDMRVSNMGGSLDNTLLSIPTFKMKIADNPIEAKLSLSSPLSDPFIDFACKGKLDLGNIKDIVPMEESVQLSGLIESDLEIVTKMSFIDQEQFERVRAEGNLGITNFTYHDPAITPYPIKITEAKGNFQPEYFDLKFLEMTVGKSDFRASGRVDNLLSYALKDTTLKGSFTLQSKLIDLNELMNLPETEEAASTDSSVVEVYVRLPENIDFQLDSEIQQVLFSDLKISNLVGKIGLVDQKVSMENVAMEMLGGSVKLNGFYDSKPEKPVANFDLGLENFGLKESFTTFNTVQSLAPIAQNAQGQFSTQFKLESAINKDMSLDLSTLSSTGALKTIGVILQTEVTQKIAQFLNNDNYKSLSLNNSIIDYEIKDGRLFVSPFDVKTGNLTGTIQGSNGLDKSLDYVMNLKIPISDIQSSGILSQLAGKAGKVDLIVNIGGTVDKPTVKSSLGGMAQNLKTQVVDSVKKVIEQKKEQVTKMAADEVERIMKQARNQADKIVNEAKMQAANLNTEAAKSAKLIREEADNQGKKLIQEAGNNPIKKRVAQEAANKLNSEANQKANKLESEAKAKGDQLVKNAENQADKIMSDAEAKTRINP